MSLLRRQNLILIWKGKESEILILKMNSLDDAWRESERRRHEIELRNLTFPDRELEKCLAKAGKDLRDKGCATLNLPEHIKRRLENESIYIMQPVLNHYRELRGESLIYI